MKKLMISLSVADFALAMMANIQYALDGYGVDNSNLHAQVLAQSTGTGGITSGDATNGGGSGSGTGFWDTWLWIEKETTVECGVTNWTRTIFYGASGQIVAVVQGASATFTGSYSSTKVETGSTGGYKVNRIDCSDGPNSVNRVLIPVRQDDNMKMHYHFAC